MSIGIPTECDIERRRGDTRDLRIKLSENGVALDVTGYTALLTINVEKEPADITNQVFQATGAPVPGSEAEGLINFDFDLFDSNGADVQPGAYFYDVQVTDAASERSTPLIGKFTVKQDITKTGG